MYDIDESPDKYAWIVYAIAFLLVGGLMGYLLAVGGASSRPAASAPVAQVAAPVTAAPIVDDGELRAYREILARDPKNFQAAVKAGNLLYDAQRYHEAIGFYQQAFAINSSDINVSTDLGTALWYAGRPDDALRQYDQSLRIDSKHAQTLFNIGIVRADGKGDYAGALLAWETLLTTSANYPDIARVQGLIDDARRHLAPAR
jgi:Flp pilus assembly protein TadD